MEYMDEYTINYNQYLTNYLAGGSAQMHSS